MAKILGAFAYYQILTISFCYRASTVVIFIHTGSESAANTVLLALLAVPLIALLSLVAVVLLMLLSKLLAPRYALYHNFLYSLIHNIVFFSLEYELNSHMAYFNLSNMQHKNEIHV